MMHTWTSQSTNKGWLQKGIWKFLGVDYEESFAPVLKFTSIRVLLALVSHFNLELLQMDATAFLNGYLNETIHIEQPEGYLSRKTQTKFVDCKRRGVD
jgi:Reverse transcriptase (RNA-dependent DNA polymerase)